MTAKYAYMLITGRTTVARLQSLPTRRRCVPNGKPTISLWATLKAANYSIHVHILMGGKSKNTTQIFSSLKSANMERDVKNLTVHITIQMKTAASFWPLGSITFQSQELTVSTPTSTWINTALRWKRWLTNRLHFHVFQLRFCVTSVNSSAEVPPPRCRLINTVF